MGNATLNIWGGTFCNCRITKAVYPVSKNFQKIEGVECVVILIMRRLF